MKVKVFPLLSESNYNNNVRRHPVANHYVIKAKTHESACDIVFFQSYDSIVAKYNTASRELTLGKDWDYSRVTLKHLKSFIHEYCPWANKFNIDEIRKMIANGSITYDERMN